MKNMRQFYLDILTIHKDIVFIKVEDDSIDFPPEVVLVTESNEELCQNEFVPGTETFSWFDEVHAYLDAQIENGVRVPGGYYC